MCLKEKKSIAAILKPLVQAILENYKNSYSGGFEIAGIGHASYSGFKFRKSVGIGFEIAIKSYTRKI